MLPQVAGAKVSDVSSGVIWDTRFNNLMIVPD
jgi:hypothetical protein